MLHEPNLATRAASFAAGAQIATSLLDAASIEDVLAIIEASVNPSESHNGIYLDQMSFREGVLTGLAKAKEVAVLSRGMEWPSPGYSFDHAEIDEAIMEGYWGT